MLRAVLLSIIGRPRLLMIDGLSVHHQEASIIRSLRLLMMDGLSVYQQESSIIRSLNFLSVHHQESGLLVMDGKNIRNM